MKQGKYQCKPGWGLYLIGHKSNRLLILRDYIVSAASEINAGGGSNGRHVAVVKSSLIDLELLTIAA